MSYTSIAVFLPSDHIFLPPTHYCLVAKKLPCWEFFVGVASGREESLLRPSALGRALGTPVSQNCFSPHTLHPFGQIPRTKADGGLIAQPCHRLAPINTDSHYSNITISISLIPNKMIYIFLPAGFF